MGELATRSISAIILAAAVLFITWWDPISFALMCILGGWILWKEWRALTATRGAKFLLFGAVYIVSAVASLIWLRQQDIAHIWLLFALVWGADIAAYLVGKKLGKHKIIPRISPGKSWEGLAGAVVASALVLSLMAHYALPTALLLGTAFAVVGLLGDLFESSLKRHAGVKDSGTLIPGHGGLFDRVDALLPCSFLLVCVLLSMGA
jgi:phosphatidate cytidylyltransferase